MNLLQLDPPLPLNTPKGPGLAHVMIDYGPEHHLIWVVFLDTNGECWAFPNPEIRMRSNPTMGRPSQSFTASRMTETETHRGVLSVKESERTYTASTVNGCD